MLCLTFAGMADLLLAMGTAGITVAQDDTGEGAIPVGVATEDTHLTQQTWDATDPRLSGETACRLDPSSAADGGVQLRTHDWTVVNAEGSWTGTRYSVFSIGTESDAVLLVLHGKGAYEGLTAYLEWGDEPEEYTIRGVIVGGDTLRAAIRQ